MMSIVLSESQVAYAEEKGRLRGISQQEAGRHDGIVSGDSMQRNKEGAVYEYAASLALNVPWDGAFKPIKEWDSWKHIGTDIKGIEVRGTKYYTGQLLIQKWDKDGIPYVLVISNGRYKFRLVGWIYAKDGKQEKYWNRNMPRPCFMVPQRDLKNIESLTK
jgi:hypothetical protein